MPEARPYWPVRVINMAGAEARMKAAAAALDAEGIAFCRFDAVDGRALPPEEVARIHDADANRRRFRYPLLGGELGCYLSHIGVWRELLAGDAPGAVVLEDDFTCARPLRPVLEALARDGGGWDMVKLYTRRPGARMLRRRPLCEGAELALPYQIPNTTLGYVIRREAAARLLARALPISRPVDEDHKRFWEHGLAIWQVLPPPLQPGPEATGAGSIAESRRQARAAPLRQGLRNLRYRAGYLAALHWHRLTGNGGR